MKYLSYSELLNEIPELPWSKSQLIGLARQKLIASHRDRFGYQFEIKSVRELIAWREHFFPLSKSRNRTSFQEFFRRLSPEVTIKLFGPRGLQREEQRISRPFANQLDEAIRIIRGLDDQSRDKILVRIEILSPLPGIPNLVRYGEVLPTELQVLFNS